MQGAKCAVMWGVGCGRSSYFCWRGNVCLPRSLPCNGDDDDDDDDNDDDEIINNEATVPGTTAWTPAPPSASSPPSWWLGRPRPRAPGAASPPSSPWRGSSSPHWVDVDNISIRRYRWLLPIQSLCILYCFSVRPRLAPPHPALPAAGLRARLPGQGEAAQRLRAGDGAHRGSLPTHLPACQNIRCARHP